jgi:coenzyme F420-0:L-glutamate ligase / coenzyme F420-1:gamma-L-glutamate ligase
VSGSEIQIIGIAGIPEVTEGDDVGSLIIQAARRNGVEIVDGDVLVVAQKIVSKSEGQFVRLDSIVPSPRAIGWAEAYDKDPRMVEVVFGQARRIVRMERGVLIAETRHGLICANAGVDASNVPDGTVLLLPDDPDKSALNIQKQVEEKLKVSIAVIIADTFGRPWREGLVNVAIGVAGIAPLIDYRGKVDSHGRPLKVTVIGTADELASAAELVMNKNSGIPAAIIRGFKYERRQARGSELIRPEELDLFR